MWVLLFNHTTRQVDLTSDVTKAIGFTDESMALFYSGMDVDDAANWVAEDIPQASGPGGNSNPNPNGLPDKP